MDLRIQAFFNLAKEFAFESLPWKRKTPTKNCGVVAPLG